MAVTTHAGNNGHRWRNLGGQAMNPVEATNEEVQTAGSSQEIAAATPGQPPWRDPIEVMPMIRKAVEKHLREWPELMKRHPYQWAAYRGDERLEIGKSQHRLYRKYLDRGLGRDELVVLGIGPDFDDGPDGEEPLGS